MSAKLDPEVERILYLSVGAIVVHWGFIDNLLSQTVQLVYESVGHDLGDKLPEKPPYEFGRRVKFLKLAARKSLTLKPNQAEIIKAMHSLGLVVGRRHLITHGAISALHEAGAGFEFTKLDLERDGSYSSVSERLSLQELIMTTERAKYSITVLLNLLDGLRKTLVPDQAKQEGASGIPFEVS